MDLFRIAKLGLQFVLIFFALNAAMARAAPPESTIIPLTDDGGWCWFQDERPVIVDAKLVVGCVANGRYNPDRKGDIQAVILNLETGKSQLVELHDQLGADDHNAPAFTTLPGGRLLVVYAAHGVANSFLFRISAANDPTKWGPIQQFVPTQDSRITYSNVFHLSDDNDLLLNFYRGHAGSFKPSYALSEDLGRTWEDGGVLLCVPGSFRHRPYVTYASDGAAVIHLIYTNGHPRDYDNSLFHVYYRDGQLHRSDGQLVATLAEGISDPEQGRRIFSGNEQNVAWPCDVHLDNTGNPVVV